MGSRGRDTEWTPVKNYILIGASLIIVFAMLVKRYLQHQSSPTMTITRIFVHPIKSCRGTSVSSSEYTPQGLKHDRTFVIVEEETHKTITARAIPKMVLIHPSIQEDRDAKDASGGVLEIQFPESSGLASVRTALEPRAPLIDTWKRIEDVQIWSDTTDAYVCQPLPGSVDPSKTLSTYLERPVLLVFKGPSTRHLAPTHRNPSLQGSAAFQDGYPILLVTEESLVDVQQKVSLSASGVDGWSIKGVAGEWTGELTMERFRPNIVLEGAGKPYAEEEWREIAFANSRSEASTLSSDEYGRMMCVSRCTRCQLPNIEPTTGVQHAHVPYKVLAKYRRVDQQKPHSPCFGINAIPTESNGRYKIGDKVRVVDWVADGKLLPLKPVWA